MRGAANCARQATGSNRRGRISQRRPWSALRAHPALHAEGLPTYVLDWLDHDARRILVRARRQRIARSNHRSSAAHFRLVSTPICGAASTASSSSCPAANSRARINTWSPGPGCTSRGETASASTDFGPEALLDTDAILLRWFNHWLKDSGEFADEPRIRHFVLGENRWRDAESFPATSLISLSAQRRPRELAQRRWRALDHTARVRRTVRHLRLRSGSSGPRAGRSAPRCAGHSIKPRWNWATICSSITTPPLAEPLRIFGIPQLKLYCHTSAAHADFTAKLVRVRPNGAADFICMGIARSSLSLSRDWIRADKIHHWQFELEPTSCRLCRGDRIRLEIASSAFPLYDRNPGSGVPSAGATSWDWQRSTQIVHH